MGSPGNLLIFLLLSLLSLSFSQSLKLESRSFGPFNNSYYDFFSVEKDASISNQALQITPDTLNDNFNLLNRSGRVMYNKAYKLFHGGGGPSSTVIASFNSSFLVNIFRPQNRTPAEGLAFLIASSVPVPAGSEGQYLGLTNSSLNGNQSNQFIAVELDTRKQDFDINDNHIGLDVNGVDSIEAFNLTQIGIQLAPEIAANYTIWVEYTGSARVFLVYIAKEKDPKPSSPVINRTIDLSQVLSQDSYFGFAASTGNDYSQLNCILKWNLTVEILPRDEKSIVLTVVLATVIPAVVVVVVAVGVVVWWLKYRKQKRDKTEILGTTLRSLPGTPREFQYKDLKKATNSFDEKMKLGEGGFGVVYKGFLQKENIEVAVKLFSRDKMKGIDDFLAELSIINRLRHKHLVRLVGGPHLSSLSLSLKFID